MVRGSLAETAGVLGRPRRALLLAALRLPTRRFPLLLKLAWKCLCYECVGAGNASLGTATTPESAVPGWAMAIHALVPARTCRAASPAPPSSSQHFSVGGSRRTGHTRNPPCPAHPSAAVPPWKLLSLSLPYLFRGLRLLGVQLGEGFISACPFWQEGTTSFSTPPRQGRDPLAVRTGLCPGGSNCDHTGAETGFRAHGWQHLQLPSDSSPQGRPCPQCPLHPQPLQ